jgi:hypothetical protein
VHRNGIIKKNLRIIVYSWTVVGVHIWRYKESRRISRLFKETNGFVYINLQLAAYVNDLLIYPFGFFGTIKFVRLCRLHRRLASFGKTLENAGKELGSLLGPLALSLFTLLVVFICMNIFLSQSLMKVFNVRERIMKRCYHISSKNSYVG